jgi:D-aminopeptidase
LQRNNHWKLRMLPLFANAITDVPGLNVGHAHDATICSGVTVLIGDAPFTAAVDIRGGAPGTRETDAVGLAGSIDEAHAIVLSGGSAFGLAAASGVHAWLAARGVGFRVGDARVPIVPAAILFDLLNGGDKAWGEHPPYDALGRAACAAAVRACPCGSIGAGYGATTATLRGGLGTASVRLPGGVVVGALAAVNPLGSVTIGTSHHFWPAPFEQAGEFGGHGLPREWPADALTLRLKTGSAPAPQNTTIAIVATNAALSKRECHRLAVMAQTGLARAIYPVHTPLDGDVVFGVSTGMLQVGTHAMSLSEIGAHAANALARAIARGVYAADATPAFWAGPPAYRQAFL